MIVSSIIITILFYSVPRLWGELLTLLLESKLPTELLLEDSVKSRELRRTLGAFEEKLWCPEPWGDDVNIADGECMLWTLDVMATTGLQEESFLLLPPYKERIIFWVNIMTGLKVNQYCTLLYGWLCERARWSNWLPERTGWVYLARSGLPVLVPQKRNFVGVMFWPYNESFIDQACSVKVAGYWPLFFCVFIDVDFVSVHKNAKRTTPISSHLDLMLGQ